MPEGEDEKVDDSPLEKKIDDQPVKTASDKKKTEEIHEQKAKPSSNKNSTQVARNLIKRAVKHNRKSKQLLILRIIKFLEIII